MVTNFFAIIKTLFYFDCSLGHGRSLLDFHAAVNETCKGAFIEKFAQGEWD